MNNTEYFLSVLIEECAEVAQRATKAQRFGIGEIQPDQLKTNVERLTGEYADLIGAWELLVDSGIVDMPTRAAIDAKKAKVLRYMEYSRECGTLIGGTDQ